MSYNILPTSNYYYNDRPQRKTSLLGRLFRIPKMDFEVHYNITEKKKPVKLT